MPRKPIPSTVSQLLGQNYTKTLVAIVQDERWTRTQDSPSGFGGWITVPCFRFEYRDGSHSWADMLDDEQREFFLAQHKD